MSRGTSRSLFFVLLIIVTCGFLGSAAFSQRGNSSYATGASDNDVRDSLRQFSEVYNLVEQNYAEPVNPDKAIYNGAIPGMLHVLDPHSNFFDPKSYSLLREEQSGKYYGVGMQIAPRNNKIIVVAPFAGTPAYKAGLRPGDVIIAVDAKATDNMSVSDVADLLKGPKGTNVHISILRESTEKPLEFNVIRDEIPRNSVDLKFMVRPGIG
ncbi:MAG: S41 family peptidase, partial [Candidatus Angelobacter sp.]